MLLQDQNLLPGLGEDGAAREAANAAADDNGVEVAGHLVLAVPVLSDRLVPAPRDLDAGNAREVTKMSNNGIMAVVNCLGRADTRIPWVQMRAFCELCHTGEPGTCGGNSQGSATMVMICATLAKHHTDACASEK